MIWFFSGIFFMLSDIIAIGDNPVVEGAIDPNIEVFAFAITAVTLVGLLVGFLEVVYINRLFYNTRQWKKIVYKFLLYVVLFSVIISIVYPIAAAIETDTSVFDAVVWQKYRTFWGSLPFWGTCLQLTFNLVLSVFYAAFSENLGHSMMINFFTGKYSTPEQEERIFMFVDMKASTAIAESLGHKKYFDLLQRYYLDLSNAIINNFGEVYQYVGDEIVITWPKKTGLHNSHCIHCFYAMQHDLLKHSKRYTEKYGVVPSFKAGMHLGMVTIGEIGALKKEIVFTGDPLNVTSRIQGLCNELGEDLIISNDLAQELAASEFKFQDLGTFDIRGRRGKMRVFKVL